MHNKLNTFFTRYEFLLPLFVFAIFLTASLPGNSWGAPALWNPDELVWRVDMALHGNMQFDVTEPDYNYPSLPKYVMYAIGYVTYGLGRSTYAFIVAARSFSAFLGALVGIIIYYIARMLNMGKFISTLAGLLYIASGVAIANSRFAHNDLYLQLFTILCLYFVVKFQYTKKIGWLLFSFISVGMAASSKYTGISMVLLPVSVLIFLNWEHVRNNVRWFLGVLVSGAVLVIVGYGIGTPQLVISPVKYLSNAIPAALRFSQYGFNSGTPVGLYGQWKVLHDTVGAFLYYLYLIGLIWMAIRIVLYRFGKADIKRESIMGLVILGMNILIFDLPFLISINYISRHFIPFMPLLALLSAFFIEEVITIVRKRNLNFIEPVLISVLFIGLVYSTLRLVSIALLFMNDARIPATEYVADIRGYGKSIEYTLYPPVVEKKRFMRAHNYPIYFVKYTDDVVPTGGRYEYNLGEKGLLERNTDYFVADSYTYDRFYESSICDTNPVECDFFKRLITGKVTSYYLLTEFKYRLPAWLPQVSISAVNPDILIFERVPKP